MAPQNYDGGITIMIALRRFMRDQGIMNDFASASALINSSTGRLYPPAILSAYSAGRSLPDASFLDDLLVTWGKHLNDFSNFKDQVTDYYMNIASI